MVLDAEAITALLESGHPARRRVRRIIKAARPTARVAPPPPTVTMAELDRGIGRSPALDALLARYGNSGCYCVTPNGAWLDWLAVCSPRLVPDRKHMVEAPPSRWPLRTGAE